MSAFGSLRRQRPAAASKPGRAVLVESAELARGSATCLFVLRVDAPRSATEDVARHVLRRLRAWLPAGDVVVRLGAAAFGVLTAGVTAHDCPDLTRRITSLLGEPMDAGGRQVTVRITIGSAIEGVGEGLVQAGEEALDLLDALREGQIRAVFEPMVCLGGEDRVIAVEALPGWTRHDGSDVDPRHVAAVAGRLERSAELGWQVLERGLDEITQWYAEGVPVGRLALDVTQTQLDDEGFASAIATLLAQRALPANCLMVQIGSVGGAQAPDTLARLDALGVAVITDDADDGALPLSAVRLRGSLSQQAVTDCHHRGLRCVAAGVDTAEQLALARRLGVDAVQGSVVAELDHAPRKTPVPARPTVETWHGPYCHSSP